MALSQSSRGLKRTHGMTDSFETGVQMHGDVSPEPQILKRLKTEDGELSTMRVSHKTHSGGSRSFTELKTPTPDSKVDYDLAAKNLSATQIHSDKTSQNSSLEKSPDTVSESAKTASDGETNESTEEFWISKSRDLRTHVIPALTNYSSWVWMIQTTKQLLDGKRTKVFYATGRLYSAKNSHHLSVISTAHTFHSWDEVNQLEWKSIGGTIKICCSNGKSLIELPYTNFRVHPDYKRTLKTSKTNDVGVWTVKIGDDEETRRRNVVLIKRILECSPQIAATNPDDFRNLSMKIAGYDITKPYQERLLEMDGPILNILEDEIDSSNEPITPSLQYRHIQTK